MHLTVGQHPRGNVCWTQGTGAGTAIPPLEGISFYFSHAHLGVLWSCSLLDSHRVGILTLCGPGLVLILITGQKVDEF